MITVPRKNQFEVHCFKLNLLLSKKKELIVKELRENSIVMHTSSSVYAKISIDTRRLKRKYVRNEFNQSNYLHKMKNVA
jgi:hypothetical protein